MHKFFLMIVMSSILLCVISCKQFLKNMEEDFSYWSNQALITEVILPAYILDKNDIPSIPSTADQELVFTIANPKNYFFKLAGEAGAPSDILVFESTVKGAGGGEPVAGTDYTMSQEESGKLKLKFKKDFLEQNEYGAVNIAPTVTLYNREGRRFAEQFKFTLRVNTPPPALECKVIGKTKRKNPLDPQYYVLCLRVPESKMTEKIGAELLHKDIAVLSVTGNVGEPKKTFQVRVNDEGTDFYINGTDGALLAYDQVEKLEAADIDEGDITELSAEAWILRFKTDVRVRGGSKEYDVTLIDQKGLRAPELRVSTSKTKVQPVKLFDSSAEIHSATESSPYQVNTAEHAGGIMLKAKTATSFARITGMVEKKDGPDNWTKIGDISGTGESDISLDAPLDEKEYVYRITVKAGAQGFHDSGESVFYVKTADLIVFTIAAEIASGDSVKVDWKEGGTSKTATVSAEPCTLKIKKNSTEIKVSARCTPHTFLERWHVRGGDNAPTGYTVRYPDGTGLDGKTLTAVFKNRAGGLPQGLTLSDDGTEITSYEGTEPVLDLNALGLSNVARIANDGFRKKTGISGTPYGENTTLQEVVLPDSLERLGSYAFFECTALKKITVPKNFIGDIEQVFPGCTALEEYVIEAGNPRYCLSIPHKHLCSGKQQSDGSYDFNDLTLVSAVFKPASHPTLKIEDARIKTIKNMAAEFHTFTAIELRGLTGLSQILQYAFFRSGAYTVKIDCPQPPLLPHQPSSVFVGASGIQVPAAAVSAYQSGWPYYAAKITGY